MGTSEQQLENQLIDRLGEIKYSHRPDIRDRKALERNFREKFEAPKKMTKMGALLGNKSTPVTPASDATQRGRSVKVSSKLSNDEIVNLSFKVPTGFRKRFKLAAVNAGIAQNDLVIEALAAWEKKWSIYLGNDGRARSWPCMVSKT